MRYAPLFLLALFVPACSSSTEPPAADSGFDAATNRDDAATLPDATTIPDATHAPDAIVDDGGHDSGADAFSAPDAFTAPDAGHDASVDAAGAACPPNPPTNGTSCAPADLECSYGEDPRVSCRIHATCNHGTWLVTAPPCSAPPTCPSTEPPAGTACATTGAACGYATDTCVCYSCSIPCTQPTTWHCSAAAATCPTSPPNLGSPCTGSAICNYGNCVGGEAVECMGGAWVSHPTACPG